MSNQQLAEELNRPIIGKFEQRKLYSSFKENIYWVAGLADIELISKHNKGIQFLLCIIDIFSRYPKVVSLKDKNCIAITNALKNIFR